MISGFTAINDGRGTDDCNGHGTHVSGTVGGSTYGVAKNVTLVAVRVLDCAGSGTNSGVIAGVDFVTSNHAAGQPAVANMSLGGGASSALDTAVNNSISDGVTYAIAAGNSNVDACTQSPARVAAITGSRRQCAHGWFDDDHRRAFLVFEFLDLRRYLCSGLEHNFFMEHERHRHQYNLGYLDGDASRDGRSGALS